MNESVTIVIPTIPPRIPMLQRAVASVLAQTHPVAAVSIAVDTDHDGAWTTRNRAMATVQTDWLGFLDDDDDLYAHHVATLLELADTTGAGMVWGWFDVYGGTDPFPENRGRQFDPDAPHTVPITYLIRTDIARKAVEETGGFVADDIGAWDNQDAPFFLAAARIGGTACTPQVTWRWSHHGRNTSGLPGRWQ